jgi:hypothetical protein
VTELLAIASPQTGKYKRFMYFSLLISCQEHTALKTQTLHQQQIQKTSDAKMHVKAMILR